ncbi:hypothetical protein QJQ45_023768 [Haematococcus lacustris]|nr:hypothetical protein QJQ45_023768 [Haematococcus lacustris]
MEELTELPKELFAGVYSSRLLRRSHPPVSHPPVSSAGAMLFALLNMHCLPFAAAPIPSPADKSAAYSVAAAASTAAAQPAAGQSSDDVRLVAATRQAGNAIGGQLCACVLNGGLFTLLRSDLAITKAQQTSTVNKKTLF